MTEYLKLLNDMTYDFHFNPFTYDEIKDPNYTTYKEILKLYLNDIMPDNLNPLTNYIKNKIKDENLFLCKFYD